MKKSLNRTTPFFIILLLILIFVTPLFSEAADCSNIAFRKDVPTDIRQTYPLCDEFLDIKWIDTTGKFKIKYFKYYDRDKWQGMNPRQDLIPFIGKLKVEDFDYQKKRKENFYILIVSTFSKSDNELSGTAFYKITREDYLNRDFEHFITGSVFQDYSDSWPPYYKLIIEKGKKKRVLEDFNSVSAYGCRFKKNICGLNPDGVSAFFNKTKHPFRDGDFKVPYKKADLTGELKDQYDAILKFAQEKCLEEAQKRREAAIFKRGNAGSDCLIQNTINKVTDSTIAIDVNRDGKAVYFFGTDAGWFVYFSEDGKKEFKKVGEEFSLNCFLNEKSLSADKCDFLKEIK